MSSPPAQSGFLFRADQLGRFIENFALFVVLLAMVLLAAAQIVMRNFLDIGLAWGDEALRLMVLWVTMLGAVAATRERRHIVIDILARLLPDAIRPLAAFFVDAFTAAVTGTLAWYSAVFVADSRAYEDVLFNNLPAWLFQLILPIGFGLIAYRYVIWCLRHLGETFGRLKQT